MAYVGSFSHFFFVFVFVFACVFVIVITGDSSQWIVCVMSFRNMYGYVGGSLKHWKSFKRVFSGKVGMMTDRQSPFQLIDSAHPTDGLSENVRERKKKRKLKKT